MRALITEQHYSGGHYLYWVASVVRGLDGVASEILVAIPPKAVETPQFKINLQPLRDRFTLVELSPDRPGNPAKMILRLSDIHRDVIAQTRADALYLPTGDGTVDALNLARLLGRNVLAKLQHSEVLLMRRPGAYGVPDPRMPAAIGNLSIRLGQWSRILTTCPIIARWLQSSCGPRVASRATVAPDPIENFPLLSHSAARAKLGLPDDGRIVSALGMNDIRKGVDLLLDAFSASKGLRSTDRLLIAGPCSQQVRQHISATRTALADPDRLIVLDQYCSHEELHTLACASDLVAVPYRSVTQPSGIAIRALAAHRPVISNNKGWFGYMVPLFSLGTMCNVESIPDFAAALVPALDNAAGYRLSPAAQRLLAYQAPENFSLTWRAGLTSKVPNLPPQPQPLSWDWVLQGIT